MRRDGAAPIFVNATGVGASAYDSLKRLKLSVHPVVNSSSTGRDVCGALTFANLRTECYWRMREAEGAGLTLDAVSERAGFSDPRHFRRVWKSVSGLTPSASRAALASR